MVKLILRGFVFLLLVVFFINYSSASFTKGSPAYSLSESPTLGSLISGWINISLKSESSSSILESSLGGSISLIDLINNDSNSNFEYTCKPSNCISKYDLDNSESSKTASLDENESLLIGFNISGTNSLSSVTDFAFNLTSDNPKTEKLPIAIDILNDGSYEFISYNHSNEFGEINFGCFKKTSSTDTANIADVDYCEKIKLKRSPGVRIGAYVKGDEEINFSMSIEDIEGDNSESCTAASTGSGEFEEVGCVPEDYPIEEEGSYFVCIRVSDSDDSEKYEMKYEQSSPCGFTDSYNGDFDYDFEIFAEPELYPAYTNFTMNDDALSENTEDSIGSIESYLEEYISDAYNNKCSKGCVIPVRIFSGIDQEITISDASLRYVAGVSKTINKFYEVTETPAKINATFQKLYLDDAGFYVPEDTDEDTEISITLDSKEIFSDEVTVLTDIPKITGLLPLETGISYSTVFQVSVNNSETVTEYKWDFGDGSEEETTTDYVSHTYDTSGTYTLNVTAVSSLKTASKSYSIVVEPASEIVPTIFEEMETNLETINTKISSFTSFEQKAINQTLGISQTEIKLKQIKTEISSADSNSEYGAILNELLAIQMPEDIAKTIYSSGLSFYTISNNINLDTLNNIWEEKYDTEKEDLYKDSIIAWDEENINTVMSYTQISAMYDSTETPILNSFELSILNQGTGAYLVIKNLSGLMFASDYSQKKTGEYYYMPLKEGSNEITFATSEDITFDEVPMFISPEISELVLSEWNSPNVTQSSNKWVIFGIVIAVVLIIMSVVWIILRYWYKMKYETFLFKNRNNLYNLMSYINNEKVKGTAEKEINEKLKKSGWSSEQVRYALRKHAGKRTGMPELILKNRERKKAENMNRNVLPTRKQQL